jgi:peptide deformylase
MVITILKYGSPVLRKHSGEITEEDNLVQMVKDLFDTLKKEGGLGLAAPQIGILKRVFLMDTSPLNEDDPTTEKIEQAFINPEIIGFSAETIFYEEGCLSIPGIYESVERPVKIRVRYQDTFFNTIEKELDGMQARIFQHEFDHLNGILFIDRLSLLRRKLLTGKLNKIRNL